MTVADPATLLSPYATRLPIHVVADEGRDPPSQRLRQWLLAIARRDERALRSLMGATRLRLHLEALRLVRTPECAEEVLQDVWWRVWCAAGTYDAQVSRPMTWLLRIVQHRAIDRLRAQRQERERRVDLDETVAVQWPDPAPGPESRCADALRERALQRSLSALSPEHRGALQLVLRGCTPLEIAACCRVPATTARTRLRRGLLRLQADAELRRAA